jgi:hypothetical protein
MSNEKQIQRLIPYIQNSTFCLGSYRIVSYFQIVMIRATLT